MRILDTPFSFTDHIVFRGVEVRFLNLQELGQGGPELGKLNVFMFSGLRDARFSGPFLTLGNYLLVIRYERQFWGSGFRFFAFDVESLEYFESSFWEGFILIRRIEGECIFYNTSVSDPEERRVDFSPERGFIRVQ